MLKDTKPSKSMHASDGNSYRCGWLEDSITIHCDGNVTCGFDDPNADRSFGNVKYETIEEIFLNPEIDNLRTNLLAGQRCIGCSLYKQIEITAPENHTSNQVISQREVLPRSLIIEPTMRCNIRCLNEACYKNNDKTINTRSDDFMSLELFRSIIDQLATGLRTVAFFNYGDAFVNKRADDMLVYLREACPSAYVVTSTNGIPLGRPERAAAVVRSQLNLIVFTISGMTQDSYSTYHVGGKLDQALLGMTNISSERRVLGLSLPVIDWRYILFRWNDSVKEVESAIKFAKENGVDRLVLYLRGHFGINAERLRRGVGWPGQM